MRFRVKIKTSMNKIGAKGNIVGIDFCETSEEVKETILNYAFEVKRQDLVKHWFRGWK